MPNRRAVLLILLAGIFLVAGCKKSSESTAPNFFGTPPVVSEVSITKELKHFHCIEPLTELCCVPGPYPQCSCCCIPDDVLTVDADLDLVKMSAKVTDAEGPSNLLVILARFFDPPTTTGTFEVSLEMFDTGGTRVGTIATGNGTFDVISGDAVANDGVFTRYFYMRTDADDPNATTGNCILTSDTHDNTGTYSEFTTTSTFPATKILNYSYHVEAVDRAGNVTPSPATTLPIVKTAITNVRQQLPCGAANGLGGCQPPVP